MQLSDLPQRQNPRPKIHGLCPGDYPDGWVEFDHLDGMYSFCEVYDEVGNYLGVVHLKFSMPLEPYLDGYRLAREDSNLQPAD
ncbi:hypothetical protein DQP57_00290 [Mycobacterium colombiense]|uniref:Uncharacterized protein n=1 Tax=Mycobacterium colombiense TaxID=339268 RepID=A0A329MD37_9MYCO|nr:hypothetical protein DQP57_00290 [Mycobacterium colombiense]